MNKNDKSKKITKDQIKKQLDKSLTEFESKSKVEYDKYFKPGSMYLSTFDMSINLSSLDSPRGDMLQYFYDKGANVIAIMVSAAAIYIGFKVSVHGLGKLVKGFGDMISSLTNLKYLGLFMMIIGVFIIGLKLYLKRNDKVAAMKYMKTVTNGKVVMGKLADDMISASRHGEISARGLMKKSVYSLLSIFDIAVSSFSKLMDNIDNDRTTQAGVVIFVIGVLSYMGGKQLND